MKEFTIGKNDAGQRLDKYLSKSLPLLPQSLMYKAIRKKKIKVNRARADISQKLCEGDTLQLFLPDDLLSDNGEAKAEPYRTITPHIDIIYEDEEIILIDKKPGMAVHGGDDSAGGGSRIDERDTLINNVLAYLWREGKYDPDTERSFTPALCNRIDRNTGGIVIAAKTAEALCRINEEIRAGEVTKRYLCAVHGYMEKKRGRLTGWMEKDAQHGIVHVHFGERKTPNGRTMITDYRVLAEERELSLLEVTLVTGRTHQIRAQMQAAGHPLLGEGNTASTVRIAHAATHIRRCMHISSRSKARNMRYPPTRSTFPFFANSKSTAEHMSRQQLPQRLQAKAAWIRHQTSVNLKEASAPQLKRTRKRTQVLKEATMP